jgi:peptide/nickel transport system permease protein
MVRTGGAWLPYLLPALFKMQPEQQGRALDALDLMALRIGADAALKSASDRLAFWKNWWNTYGSDFTPVRAARLVQRIILHEDELALSELRRLDTYCLPQLMDALDEDLAPEMQSRLIQLTGELVSIVDPLDPGSSIEERNATITRWKRWWNQRYDRYTVFKGAQRLSGAITQTRYFRWLSGMLTLDFGVSTRDNRPILEKLSARLPVTLLLSFLALLTAYAVAIPLGILSAVRSGGLFDRASSVVLFVLYSLPYFWIAMLLLRYLGGTGHIDLFPAQGLASPGSEAWPLWKRLADMAHHLVLPVFCLSYVSMAMLARYQRVGMIQVIHLDFMRTARAKGLSRMRVIWSHGLRNGVIPVVTLLGLQIPYLIGGSVVVEMIFGIPGMGIETFEAICAQDRPWLIAAVTATAVLTMAGTVASDVIYALIDPRITPGRHAGRWT